MSVGAYKGFNYKRQKLGDLFNHLERFRGKRVWALYDSLDKFSGSYFYTLTELKKYIDDQESE